MSKVVASLLVQCIFESGFLWPDEATVNGDVSNLAHPVSITTDFIPENKLTGLPVAEVTLYRAALINHFPIQVAVKNAWIVTNDQVHGFISQNLTYGHLGAVGTTSRRSQPHDNIFSLLPKCEISPPVIF